MFRFFRVRRGDWGIGGLGDWVIGGLGDWGDWEIGVPRAFSECPGVLIAFGRELEFPGVFFVDPGADTYFQGYLFLCGEGFDFIDYTTDDTVVFVIGSAGL